jgi:hypothetical protein
MGNLNDNYVDSVVESIGYSNLDQKNVQQFINKWISAKRPLFVSKNELFHNFIPLKSHAINDKKLVNI